MLIHSALYGASERDTLDKTEAKELSHDQNLVNIFSLLSQIPVAQNLFKFKTFYLSHGQLYNYSVIQYRLWANVIDIKIQFEERVKRNNLSNVSYIEHTLTILFNRDTCTNF